MAKKQRSYFTKSDLVSFGNFMVSDKRTESVKLWEKGDPEDNLKNVHDSDIANWNEQKSHAK